MIELQEKGAQVAYAQSADSNIRWVCVYDARTLPENHSPETFDVYVSATVRSPLGLSSSRFNDIYIYIDMPNRILNNESGRYGRHVITDAFRIYENVRNIRQGCYIWASSIGFDAYTRNSSDE